MIEVIPLGTGSALPSVDCHFSATAVQQGSQLFLFDCGEGTQIRLLQAGLKMSRLQAVCITHLHGDHFFGLPGLLSTLSLLSHPHPLTLIGPAGLKSFLENLPAHSPENKASHPIEFVELSENTSDQIVFESSRCRIEARPIDHGVPAFGFRFEEKDRPGHLDIDKANALGIRDHASYRRLKLGESITLPDGRTILSETVVGPAQRGGTFAYVTDSRPATSGVQLARNADLVYHEATFVEEDIHRAVKTHHSTAGEAANIARKAGAKQLIIGHFSARYDGSEALLQEARQVFKNTDAAQELKRYLLPADPLPEMAGARINQ